jgi:ABC-type glycerol-3-phosphate transport system substrate-binding protein
MKKITKRMISAVICFCFLLLSGVQIGVTHAAEPNYNRLKAKDRPGTANPWHTSITPDKFIPDTASGARMADASEAYGYKSGAVFLTKGASFSFDVDAAEEGGYNISVDYYIPKETMIETLISLKIDGEYPFYESRFLKLSGAWKDTSQEYEKDRYGNELLPSSARVFKWQNAILNDNSYYFLDHFIYNFKKGRNTVTIKSETTDLLIGDIIVSGMEKLPDYSSYNQGNKDKIPYSGKVITIEGEKYAEKSDSYIGPKTEMNPSSVPYDTVYKKVNNLSGASWKTPGQSVTWSFEVKESGIYNLAFKYLQDAKQGLPSFKQILIDGRIPFSEIENYPFEFTEDKYRNGILGNDNVPYGFYLEKGTHTLTMVTTADSYADSVVRLASTIKYINDTALSIKKVTANKTDNYRDWDILEYIPGLKSNLQKYYDSLNEEYKYLLSLSNVKRPVGLNNLDLAIKKIKKYVDNPEILPNNLDGFSQGTGSVSQLLSDLMPQLTEQPLTIDRIYVMGEKSKLPKPNVSGFQSFLDEVKKLFMSFFVSTSNVQTNAEGELNVWVNRPAQYIDLMQQMADSEFTGKNRIKVNISLMPNEQKLILANAAGEAPDVVLGINSYTPYEIALRGAAQDLREYPDFGKYLNDFSPASFVPFVIGDSCCAVPETQDFNLLFYRKDILESLNLKVPDTWNDVIDILPELERYGMSFNTQISNVGAFKPMLSTSPFIHQFGGQIFSRDGMSANLGSSESVAGFKFMTDLFTKYSLPQDTPNFYSKFRNGTIPVGISGFGTYVQLTYAAPEIAGQWAIAPSVGVKQEDGTVARYQTGVATSCMIFKSSRFKDESWDFIKWWMSTSTQTEFAYKLQSKYGPSYIWNSANIEAFKNSPLPQKDKDVILEQWKWIKEVPRNPGYYMAERSISDAWNRVMFNGESPRVSLDKAIMEINREMKRKLKEFGYIDENGNVIKTYGMPTVEQINEWRE